MADDDLEAEEQGGGGGKKKIIMLAVLGILLVMLSVGGTLMALKFLGGDEPQMMDESAAGDGEAGGDEGAVMPEKKAALYYPLKPALRTNVPHRGGYRLVEVELSIMTRDSAVISEVELHKATLNNNLLMLIMRQSFDDMMTAEGKELFRQQALAEVTKVLEMEAGISGGIEQILITEFKMQ